MSWVRRFVDPVELPDRKPTMARAWGLHLAATKSSGFTAGPNRRNHGGMCDPIPGNDSSAAYDVVSSTRWPQEWWTVTCNGIPVWHCAHPREGRTLRDRSGVPRQPDRDEVCRPLRAGRASSTSRGEPVRFSISTIERWYRRAIKEPHDPVLNVQSDPRLGLPRHAPTLLLRLLDQLSKL